MKIKKNVLEILKEPHPMLRHKCRPVVLSWGADWLVTLAQNMIYIMRTVRGVGLAAPQIGEPLQLTVALIDKVPVVMVNPVILSKAEETISI
ncbi:MAG: peptide deformylase, partial [Candidatus Kaiserbacteria bacterium]|nr:peptide deformylase [Candidatus Kaiserbacteria bacterium]